jgi:hypothetical protein
MRGRAARATESEANFIVEDVRRADGKKKCGANEAIEEILEYIPTGSRMEGPATRHRASRRTHNNN